MIEAELHSRVKELAPGTEVEITFKDEVEGRIDHETLVSIGYLVMMEPHNVTINQRVKGDLGLVASAGCWDVVSRTVKLTLPDCFDPDWFSRRLWRGLESFRVVRNPAGVSASAERRTKRELLQTGFRWDDPSKPLPAKDWEKILGHGAEKWRHSEDPDEVWIAGMLDALVDLVPLVPLPTLEIQDGGRTVRIVRRENFFNQLVSNAFQQGVYELADHDRLVRFLKKHFQKHPDPELLK